MKTCLTLSFFSSLQSVNSYNVVFDTSHLTLVLHTRHTSVSVLNSRIHSHRTRMYQLLTDLFLLIATIKKTALKGTVSQNKMGIKQYCWKEQIWEEYSSGLKITSSCCDFSLIYSFFRGIAKRLPLYMFMGNPVVHVPKGYSISTNNYPRGKLILSGCY